MVEVFKTDVNSRKSANKILHELNIFFPGYLINFDLEDCDRVLRMEGDNLCAQTIKEFIVNKGFACDELE
jgi:hypothetical protein